jgi:hypothetical protein
MHGESLYFSTAFCIYIALYMHLFVGIIGRGVVSGLCSMHLVLCVVCVKNLKLYDSAVV